MKSLIPILFVFIQLVALAQTPSVKNDIKFLHDNLEEAKTLAAKENKVVFIDAYTTWCGPCKAMSRNVFTQPKVADYFNKNFINLKVNMEKSAGKKMRSAYSVRAYPTLLFIKPDGTLIKKVVGYHQAESLIKLGVSVLNTK